MNHNPNINRREQFCPCGCNADCSYTSVTTEPATHTRPTNMEWNNWWMCKDSWEEPYLSRTSTELIWSAVEQYKMFISLNHRAERILVLRMLPQYKKSVPRLVIGSLEPHLWKNWIRIISNGAPYTDIKKRNLRVGSHLPKKTTVVHTRITWRNFMPKLSEVRTQWWRKKWVNEEDGIIYRAQITKLSFGYNPMTETITAGLEYRTEYFCDEQNRWKPI